MDIYWQNLIRDVEKIALDNSSQLASYSRYLKRCCRDFKQNCRSSILKDDIKPWFRVKIKLF